MNPNVPEELWYFVTDLIIVQFSLTHYGLVMPYNMVDLCQH